MRPGWQSRSPSIAGCVGAPGTGEANGGKANPTSADPLTCSLADSLTRRLADLLTRCLPNMTESSSTRL